VLKDPCVRAERPGNYISLRQMPAQREASTRARLGLTGNFEIHPPRDTMCFTDKNLKGGADGVIAEEPPKRRFLSTSPKNETKEEAQKRKADAKLAAATRTLK